jgi:isopentenyldiphosphate isomerase
MLEEIGIEAPLEWLVKLPAGPNTANEQTVLFRTTSDAVPTPDEAEVASLTYFTLDELRALHAAEPSAFSPPFATLVEWYWANIGGRPSQQ